MIITNDGNVRFLTVSEHLKLKEVVYLNNIAVRLVGDKHGTFEITDGGADYTYIDLFGLTFGFKEPLKKREGRGRVDVQYGCAREIRDQILYLAEGALTEAFSTHNCSQKQCQYWSCPTKSESKYAFTCLLARYRVINYVACKEGFTLEEVGRIYACTRERIRQIEEKAIKRMRHKSRLDRFEAFHEKILDYRDYHPATVEWDF